MISVIIPVYNKEKYVRSCIESIMSQTYKNIEIIAVNDGSTDNSLGILQELAQEDSCIKLLTGANEGVSHARNRGLEISRGQYVTFVDADDYLQPDYLSRLYEQREYDLVVCGYRQLTDGKIQEFSCGERLANDKQKIENLYFNKTILPYMIMPCLKLFRRNLLVCHNIRFINISFGEDADFVLQYLKYCNSVKMIDYQGYINRIIPGTLSRKKVYNMWGMSKRVIERCEDVFANKYSKNWQFFYLKFVKCCLVNSCDDWHEFKDVCMEIQNDQFRYTTLNKCVTLNDLVTVFCLKTGNIKLLYRALRYRR